MTIAEVVALYDAGAAVDACRMFQDAGKEHHGQCVAMETCREFEIIGLTLEGWSAMSDEYPWAQMAINAWGRARLNTSASSAGFTVSDALTAASYAGNYFEHGYDAIIGGSGDVIEFTKTGGVVAP